MEVVGERLGKEREVGEEEGEGLPKEVVGMVCFLFCFLFYCCFLSETIIPKTNTVYFYLLIIIFFIY